MASAKWVIAGKISMSFSSSPPLRDPRGPKGLEFGIEDRGGLTRVWRTGCARRLDERSEGAAFAVFMVSCRVVSCQAVVLSTVAGVEGEFGGNAHGTKYAVGRNGSGCVDYPLNSIEGRRAVL